MNFFWRKFSKNFNSEIQNGSRTLMILDKMISSDSSLSCLSKNKNLKGGKYAKKCAEEKLHSKSTLLDGREEREREWVRERERDREREQSEVFWMNLHWKHYFEYHQSSYVCFFLIRAFLSWCAWIISVWNEISACMSHFSENYF